MPSLWGLWTAYVDVIQIRPNEKTEHPLLKRRYQARQREDPTSVSWWLAAPQSSARLRGTHGVQALTQMLQALVDFLGA
jgi:hypothetical protein